MNISFISNQVWLIAALHEPSYLCHLYFVGCLIPNTISSLSHQYRCTLMASFKFLVHRLTLITTKVTWIIGTLWEASCLTYFKVTTWIIGTLWEASCLTYFKNENINKENKKNSGFDMTRSKVILTFTCLKCILRDQATLVVREPPCFSSEP